MSKRVGATRRDDVSPDVLQGLNNGTLQSATLAEGLAVDFLALLSVVAQELPTVLRNTVRQTDGITTRMKVVGEALIAHYGLAEFPRFASHTSDTVRGWAAYMIAAAPNLTIAKRLEYIRPLADDSHFGVREWAWCAVRKSLASDILESIRLLASWTGAPSENIRRFASESTRPRGVWCAHIDLLKTNPEHGLPILEPLRSDPSKYVRDAVANWLNDAGKSQPDWLRNLCNEWERQSPTPETNYIVTKATRNLQTPKTKPKKTAKRSRKKP